MVLYSASRRLAGPSRRNGRADPCAGGKAVRRAPRRADATFCGPPHRRPAARHRAECQHSARRNRRGRDSLRRWRDDRAT